MQNYSLLMNKSGIKTGLRNLRARINPVLIALVLVCSLVGINHGSASASGNTYLVNNTVACDDANLNTSVKPFCTIGRAAFLAVAGDTVQVVAGTYPETVEPRFSGTAGNPITYTAGSAVTVTGDPLHPATGSAFRFTTITYTTINGFHIGPTAETGIYVSGLNANVIVSNNVISNTASHGIYVLSGDHVTVSNNTVSTAGGNAGIYLKSVSASTVSGNISHDNSADGIRLNASTGVTVSNNTTYSNLTAKANGIALLAASTSNTVLHNIVYANRDTGIQVESSSGNVIAGNLSYHNGDHGLDVTSSNGVAGSPNTIVVGNTFQGNYTAGINVETNSTGTTISNNIVSDNGQTPATGNPYNIYIEATSVSGTALDYNVYWMTSPYVHQIAWGGTGYDDLATFKGAVAGQETHGLQANPLLSAPAAPVTSVPPSVVTGNYHLSAGSPAIDSANADAPNEPNSDIDGSPIVDDPATTNTGAGTPVYHDRGAYEFQTGGTVAPTVTTQAATAISTTTATGNGNVTSLGIPHPTQHGVAWGTNLNPLITGSHTSDGAVNATGAFTSSIINLMPGTVYHVRAYATNTSGTSYGSDISFTSLNVPTVTTQAVTSIGTATATGNGNVTVLGVPNPTQHGVVWDTAANPTIALTTKTSDGPVGATGAFTSTITGISGGTLYHVRAYATNDAGTSYGSDVTFSIPVASTTSVNCGAGTAVVTYGAGISCVATVTRSAGSNTPTGTVSWTTGGAGTFATSPCTLAGSGASATCSVTYSPTSVGSGSHLITATYAGDANFTTSNGNQGVTVNTAAVTPVITAASKVYDGNLVASILTRSLTGIIGADNVTITGGTATFDTKAVGTGKTVTGTGFTLGGAQVANYHLASASATTTANIAAKSLTITGLTANNKVYDRLLGTTLAGLAAPVGVISGDTVTIAGSPSANFLTATVANGKPVTVSGYTLGGLDAGNYSVSQPAGLTANITPLGLTVSGVIANDRPYNGSNAATLNTTSAALNAGVISPDVVTLNSSLATATFADKNVGSAKPVTALGFGLAGADSGNYSLAQPTGLTASISQFGLTATATADNRFFNNTTAATVHMSTNKFGADDVTAAFTGASFSDANAGIGKTVSVTGITISGADAANYHLLSNAASTTATISPAPVTVTANSRAKHSGQPISFAGTEFTMAPTTLFGSDTLTSITLTSTGADAGAVDGAYPIVPNNPVVGSGLNNYALSFINGVLTVNSANSAPSITEGASIPVSMSANGKPTAFSLTLHATDPDLDTITWVVSSPATHGTASASGTGSSMVIGYAPVATWVGTDHFTVQVSDGFGGSASIVVNVTITRPVLTTRSFAAYDGQILETAENSNIGGVLNSSATLFNLGDDALNKQYRAILSFNTAGLPDNAVITAVTLKIRQQAVQGANPFLSMGNLLVDIRKGNFGTAALQAADFQAVASKTNGLTFINHPVSGGWYTRALAAANFTFVNKVGNTQFRLHFTKDDNNNHLADFIKFYSGNAPLTSQPVLIVQYYIP